MLAQKLRLLKSLNIEVFLGIELEFYSHLPKTHFSYKNVVLKDEIGEGQIEAVFPHSNNILALLKQVINFRNNFKKEANFNAFFKSSLPPSAMQFNVSVLQNGRSILNDNILHFLLKQVEVNLQHFAPSLNCKKRLCNIKGIKVFRNSPYTISVGYKENRTAMIRVRDGYFEHRLPSPKCKILKSFDSILNAIILGVGSKTDYTVNILHSNCFEEEVISSFNLKLIKNYF